MTKQEYDLCLQNCKVGTFVTVYIDPQYNGLDLSGMPSILTQFGTGEACHVEYVCQVITDNTGKVIDIKVICANGKVIAVESMSKYIPILYKIQLTLYSVPNATPQEIAGMTQYGMSTLGQPYNWDIVQNIARVSGRCAIPILGYFININPATWGTPKGYTPMSGWICSKHCTMILRVIRPDAREKRCIDLISPDYFSQGDEIQPYFRASTP
jgi:hypothetical protein